MHCLWELLRRLPGLVPHQRGPQGEVNSSVFQAEKVSGSRPTDVPVKVHGERKAQRFSAWLGGSFLASEPRFNALFKTKQEYEEVGPSCMRASAVLSA
mmetsp:Transcript_36655/g.117854  ORF Transcript_36655/g.117854 Transcript_36655/m.117854 type:complete len:98 (+) Transcript_36655:620-913(+)